MLNFIFGALVCFLCSRTKLATVLYTTVAAKLKFLPPA